MIVTFWAPPPVLQACGFKDSPTRQAWREKITLVFICIVMGGAVAFLTMGLDKALCPSKDNASSKFLRPLGKSPGEHTSLGSSSHVAIFLGQARKGCGVICPSGG